MEYIEGLISSSTSSRASKAQGCNTSTMELPIELWRTVCDTVIADATFVELMSLGQVCRSWRSWRGDCFSNWIPLQAEGVPLGPFEGFPGRLDALRDNLDSNAPSRG